MKHGFVRTGQGRLHCLEAGKGPALVLLHSNGASAFQYEWVGKHLVAALPECGHFPMIDDPTLFVRGVNRLIDLAGKKQTR